MKMKYYFIITTALCMGALSAMAQEIDSSALDTAARSSQKKSVMFMDPYEAEQMRLEEQERQAYEEAQRRAFEEEQRKAYEEEMRRMEEERRAALKPVNLFGRSLKIFAKINGEILTSRDMQDRVNIFVATTQIPITPETKDMIMNRVLDAAIDEKIKLQEAQKNGVDISEADLKKSFENFAQLNHVTTDEFKAMLKEAEVDESVFKAQMKAEMAWGRLIQRKSSQDVKVTPSEITAAIERITKDANVEKYLISEIVIPKSKADHIQDLVENLHNDPRFELYASQFSTSPTSKNGGNLGWINKGQLSAGLEKAVKNLKEGDISDPVLIGTDYYIIKLNKLYRPGVDKAPAPKQEEIRQMLENRKTEELAAKYLRNLRNKAIVERRDRESL
jgi:parvulin-like peptidyl-prolyl isomerase